MYFFLLPYWMNHYKHHMILWAHLVELYFIKYWIANALNQHAHLWAYLASLFGLWTRLCLSLFIALGIFPNVNPLGIQLSSFVQMYCNWVFVYDSVSSFFNGSCQIRHTSKGPIVHCEHCVLNCKKEKTTTTSCLPVIYECQHRASYFNMENRILIVHKLGKSFFWISYWTRFSLFFFQLPF